MKDNEERGMGYLLGEEVWLEVVEAAAGNEH